MKRRELITLEGWAVTWPASVRAPQPAMPAIGFLHPTSLETKQLYLAAFRRCLGDTGFVDRGTVSLARLCYLP